MSTNSWLAEDACKLDLFVARTVNKELEHMHYAFRKRRTVVNSGLLLACYNTDC